MSPQLAMACFALGGGLTLALSGFLWIRRRRSPDWGEALAVASVPVCVYVAVALAVVSATVNPSREQDSFDMARLTPSVALAEGYAVYSTSREGAVQTTMYPPVWVLSYLPVALAGTPDRVLRVGIVLTLLFSFVPVVLLFAGGAPRLLVGVLGSTAFFFISMLISSLSTSVLKPHADAPSLGFAMLACVFTLRTEMPTTRRLAGVSLLAWLSVLSKQVMLPILVVLPVWFVLVHGRRAGLRFVAWLGVTGLGLAVLLAPLFRPEGVLFNCLTIPARAPWRLDQYPRIIGVVLVGAELVIHSVPLLLILAVGVGLSAAVSCPTASSERGPRSFLAAHSWMLLVLMAITTLPFSVLGRVKVGGYINTFSPTTYFLLAAGILTVMRIPGRFKERGDGANFQLSLGLLTLCTLVLALGGAAKLPFLVADFPPRDHRAQQAYNFLTSENSRVFFPMDPLAHLLADGSLFHYGAALYDREVLARIPLSPRQLKSHSPVEPSAVCWKQSDEWVRSRYFKEYARPVDIPSLGSGWECYKRGAPTRLTGSMGRGRFGFR